MITRLKPYLEPKIWGSKTLNDRYQYDVDTPIGEAWGISMIKHKESIILDGEYQRMPFSILYEKEKALFGGLDGPFPLLVKIIDAADDLSVQVHPKEGQYKKNECWNILQASKDAKLIMGHKALSSDEFLNALEHNRLHDQLIELPVKNDDLFYIPSGKLHGIGKGIELLEVQQASDVTYRVYDYNRKQNGKTRELHIDQALAEMQYPDLQIQREIVPEYFTMKQLTCDDYLDLVSDQFGDYLYIKKGLGFIGDKEVKAHDFLFVSSKEKYRVNGKLEFLKSTIVKGLTD
jgi:mannose-6-phosphate isomerase